MVRAAIIMGMVGGLDSDPTVVVDRIASEPFEGLELGTQTATVVADTLDTTGLEVTSIMTGLDVIQSPEDELVPACRTLNCERVVLGWLDESYYASPEATRETAELLNECAAGLAEYDLELYYHNHDHEFETFGDRTAFELLVDHLDDDIGFEFDVGWVGTAGASPVEVIETYADRTPLIHLKDMVYETGESVRLGEGDLDVEGVVEAARAADVEWLIYEHEYPDDAAESMHHGGMRLAELLRETEEFDEESS